MTKWASPYHWSGLCDLPVVSTFKSTRRGVVGSDLYELRKEAGDQVAEAFKGVKFADDEYPLRVIALGCTENFSSNRNGDGFKKQACRDYHHTFVKLAKAYRDHANRRPHISYGIVKASCFNEDMGRVELLLALNKTKAAAERNKGLVADKELEKIARGQDVPVSMSCTIDYDVCQAPGCEKKAKTRDYYCDEDSCTYFGCKNGLTKVAADGFIQHVDNPHPMWFDISHVDFPADRIAYGPSIRAKMASLDHVPGGAELAELMGIGAPLLFGGEAAFLSPKVRDGLTTAGRLAKQARWLKSAGVLPAPGAVSAFPVKQLGRPGSHESRRKLAALAHHDIVLSPSDFAAWVLGEHGRRLGHKVAAEAHRVLSNSVDDDAFVMDLQNSVFLTPSFAEGQWASKHASEHALTVAATSHRIKLAALNGLQPEVFLEKEASAAPEAVEAIGRAYAVYQVEAFQAGTLRNLPANDIDNLEAQLTARLSLLQN